MPRGRNSPIMLVAFLIAGVVFMFTMKMNKPKEQGGVVVRPNVVGLAKDVELGTTIKKDDLDLVPASGDVDPSLLIKDPLEAIGKIANRFLAKGTVLRSIDLLSTTDSLASLIPEGYQAMTVPVTLPASLTNLIQVGNRVDVILTYSTGTGTQFKSLTLMKNVKVLGVGAGSGGGDQVQITLAVTPEGTKTLAYSLKRGTLNVAVRSLSETDKEQPEHFFTMAELFKDQEVESGNLKKEHKPPLTEEIEIIRGLNKEIYKFIDGKAELNRNKEEEVSKQ